ncbi:glycosyltransferase [Candidatus Woesearchaeota archaeon]|jgi:rhamnosyltransferase|nr:glycosyltransferase [Candidatus Woesearchaeota archaeon]
MKDNFDIKPQAKIAVLLAAYNGQDWIQEQVETILHQKNVIVKIFISIDFSNDDTYQICSKLERENESIIILPYGNIFGGAAKNFYRLIKDVSFSDFDYVSLSDQDDVWHYDKLFLATISLEAENARGYSSNVTAFWEDGREKLVKKSYKQKRFDYYFESSGPGCTFVLENKSAILLKKFITNNWININCIDSHDWLIYAFFRSRNISWYIDSRSLMRYRQHDSNQVGLNSGFFAYIKRLKMIKNGWYKTEVINISNIINTDRHVDFNLRKTFLIKHFYHLRRNNRDAFILLFVILLGIF